MICIIARKLPAQRIQSSIKVGGERNFWGYVNIMFNKPDPDRIKLVGPDRACAEWILRNGGTVRWTSGDISDDYNFLPPEGIKREIVEIDASNSGISHFGFPHLEGCKQLKKILLHNGTYICDQAMKGLCYGKHTLQHVQVSQCNNVTDAGLKTIENLNKLETLVIYDLESVKDLEECRKYLKLKLPKCTILTSPNKLNKNAKI